MHFLLFTFINQHKLKAAIYISLTDKQTKQVFLVCSSPQLPFDVFISAAPLSASLVSLFFDVANSCTYTGIFLSP